ncbi:MAG: DUF503 domain-containing protein [Acidobacteria bacterium]|nr:DUF503 domain-containing protein [Acidobacteriota bacterium]
MLVSVALFEIHIPFAQSLKDKRMVVKSLREKLRHRFEISAGEVGLHDLHQRARMAISFVAIDHAQADAMLEKVLAFIETNTDATLTGWTSENLEFDEMTTLGVPHYNVQ